VSFTGDHSLKQDRFSNDWPPTVSKWRRSVTSGVKVRRSWGMVQIYTCGGRLHSERTSSGSKIREHKGGILSSNKGVDKIAPPRIVLNSEVS
jgi:hypothetical protein